jgi:hypothetical protein
VTLIDSAILDAVEWACRRFQVLTGRTSIWLAVQLTNLSIVIYFAWAALYLWISSVAVRVFVGVFCAVLLYALTQTVFRVSIEAIEASAYRRVARGLRNPRRLRDAPLRVSFLTLSLLLGYPLYFVYATLRLRFAIFSYVLVVLTTVIMYLLACDPLPPTAGRLREWIGGVLRLPVEDRT